MLGTANAWNDSQRWNPKSSSLAQVLASIQAQILGVPDPFFSEGFGHEGVRDTAAGEAGSVRYNNKLRLHTLRRAVIAPLKNPPLGFEEVTKRHFAICRHRVLAQAKRWALEAQGTPLFRRFTQSYEELATLLSSDDLIHLRIPGKKVEDEKPLGSITPNETDLEALKSLDTSFYQRMSRFVVMSQSNNMSSGDDNDNNNRSPSEWVFPMEASSSTDANSEGGNEGNGEVLPGPVVGMIGEMVDAPVYNPWANGEQVNRDMPPYHQGGNAEDDDDEDLYS